MKFNADARLVAPSAILTPWKVAVDDPATQDASTVTDPANDISGIDDRVLDKGAIGTLLALALAWPDGSVPSTDPVVKVFGRYDANEPWELVPNLNGDLSQELPATDASDVKNSSTRRSTVDTDNHVWDVGAFSQFVVAIETAYAGSNSGDAQILWRLYG